MTYCEWSSGKRQEGLRPQKATYHEWSSGKREEGVACEEQLCSTPNSRSAHSPWSPPATIRWAPHPGHRWLRPLPQAAAPANCWGWRRRGRWGWMWVRWMKARSPGTERLQAWGCPLCLKGINDTTWHCLMCCHWTLQLLPMGAIYLLCNAANGHYLQCNAANGCYSAMLLMGTTYCAMLPVGVTYSTMGTTYCAMQPMGVTYCAMRPMDAIYLLCNAANRCYLLCNGHYFLCNAANGCYLLCNAYNGHYLLCKDHNDTTMLPQWALLTVQCCQWVLLTVQLLLKACLIFMCTEYTTVIINTHSKYPYICVSMSLTHSLTHTHTHTHTHVWTRKSLVASNKETTTTVTSKENQHTRPSSASPPRFCPSTGKRKKEKQTTTHFPLPGRRPRWSWGRSLPGWCPSLRSCWCAAHAWRCPVPGTACACCPSWPPRRAWCTAAPTGFPQQGMPTACASGWSSPPPPHCTPTPGGWGLPSGAVRLWGEQML